QGYWIINNWKFFELTSRIEYARKSLETSKKLASKQSVEGCWKITHGNKKWRGVVSTVDNTFAALGLLETYKVTKSEEFLKSAEAWANYLIQNVGFHKYDYGYSIKYFSGKPSPAVPNNNTLVLWFLAELSNVTRNIEYIRFNERIIDFLEKVQKETGELPYSVESSEVVGKEHYICFQYNAFELIDLLNFYRISPVKKLDRIIIRLSKFLLQAFDEKGASKFDCSHSFPNIFYYTSKVISALLLSKKFGFIDNVPFINNSLNLLLSNQNIDGSFPYSTNEYMFFKDKRFYPKESNFILSALLEIHSINK
ncbi:hypothetical protein OAO35_03900, partial [Euryarchaeota archaeon]|nr:hypothetical protein [Euryarchaeota archaeon]